MPRRYVIPGRLIGSLKILPESINEIPLLIISPQEKLLKFNYNLSKIKLRKWNKQLLKLIYKDVVRLNILII